MRKNIGFVLLICFVLCLLTNEVVYAVAGKSAIDALFGRNANYVPVELMDHSGQSYTIDDYTITLENTLYDSKTGIGYCVFSTKKTTGKVEAILNRAYQLCSEGFGENDRFVFSVDASKTIKYEKIGNILYTYIAFTHNEDDGEFGGIHLIDSSVVLNLPEEDDDSEIVYASYDFDIKESNKVAQYTIDDDTTLYVSPLGRSLFCNSRISDLYVRIDVKDGKDIIFDEAGGGGSVSYSSRGTVDEKANTQSWQHRMVFNKALDLRNIKNVEVKIF